MSLPKVTAHDTRIAAYAALVDAGYLQAFSSPGRPILWVHPKTRDRRAIGSDGAGVWHIVSYPEPSTCLARDARELGIRDGVDSTEGTVTVDWLG